jgi:hypothetical protein
MNYGPLVSACATLFPEILIYRDAAWLEQNLDVCVQKTCQHVVHAGAAEGPALELLREHLARTHALDVKALRDDRAQAEADCIASETAARRRRIAAKQRRQIPMDQWPDDEKAEAMAMAAEG